MKKLIMLSVLALLFASPMANASNVARSYVYNDLGGIYTRTTFPIDVAKVQDNEGGGKEVDLSKLRRGEAKSTNILHLVEIGNSGIDEAMKQGGITKPLYVDTGIHKIFIPLGFIPIFVREQKTIVYGE